MKYLICWIRQPLKKCADGAGGRAVVERGAIDKGAGLRYSALTIDSLVKFVLWTPIHPTVVRGARAIVLGVATTVGVAWWLAYSVDGSWTGRTAPSFRTEGALQVIPLPPRYTPDGVYFAQVQRSWRRGTEIIEGTMVWQKEDPGLPFCPPHILVEGTSIAAEMKVKLDRGEAPCVWWRADGWPLLALSAHAIWQSPDALGMSKVDTGVLLSPRQVSPGTSVRILPLQPIWSGLTINTALYALLWFLLFSTGDIRYWLRSALRRRRGQCIHCGYKLLAEQARCSECGEVISMTIK